ncbi:Fe-S protein assembly co-chaperone HscB [Buchnera aphidicola]|uniref:Fe-S protein assembly co-chaperone HscB n=1 Tax=Buchnera aphidicola TaxID=9 RepID=UPI0034648A14
MNYFKLFDLPEKFDIEVILLSKKFHQLQRKYHPDLFNNCSKLIKKNVLNNSTIVNKGYRTLRDPLTRAKYLLYLKGFNVIDENKSIYEKDFLIEQFSFYEEIDKLKRNPFNLDHFNNLLIRINKIKKKYEREMVQAFEKNFWEKAAIIVNKLFFFKNLKNNLEKLKE